MSTDPRSFCAKKPLLKTGCPKYRFKRQNAEPLVFQKKKKKKEQALVTY